MDRRTFLRRWSAVACLAMPADQPRRPDEARGARIARLLAQRHEQRAFTGAVLVAERGHIVYAGGHGPANIRTGLVYSATTPSCLASLSKPITAVAVMMLAERRRLTYDDPLASVLPGFSQAVGAATIRHLLTHTSGIPDYPTLGVDRPGVRNADILAALRRVPSPAFWPGQRYAYSNSGYVLLALIVEALTGQPFARVLESQIFGPLDMRATFVLTDPAQKTATVARGHDREGRLDDFEGLATGESGVYSTVTDLLRFDQALYTDALVSPRTLEEAFVPARVAEGQTTYGFGWNVAQGDDGRRVWHQGNTAGFRAFIERRLRDRVTVIMLTNGGDTNRMAINDDIQQILRERSSA